MTWLAVSDAEGCAFSRAGVGLDRREAPVLDDRPDTLLTRGTLLLEAHPGFEEAPRDLLGFAAARPYARGIVLRALPGGGVTLRQWLGDRLRETTVSRDDPVRRDVLRITYSWDSVARRGRLTLEQPEATRTVSVAVPDPVPPRLADLEALMRGGAGSIRAPQVVFAALSDAIEPVGPLPSLCGATPVATPDGHRPVASLRRGDTVRTRASGIVPVVHAVTRTVPARGSFAPLRIRAPYFGLGCDIVVAPEQRLLIDGSEVEYLFGQDAVLVPARHLVNGFNADPAPCGPLVRYHHLLLPHHETLQAAGSSLESLYIGRIRRDPARLAASVLADRDRSGLPEHGQPSHPVLRQFETIHLSRRRAA